MLFLLTKTYTGKNYTLRDLYSSFDNKLYRYLYVLFFQWVWGHSKLSGATNLSAKSKDWDPFRKYWNVVKKKKNLLVFFRPIPDLLISYFHYQWWRTKCPYKILHNYRWLTGKTEDFSSFTLERRYVRTDKVYSYQNGKICAWNLWYLNSRDREVK